MSQIELLQGIYDFCYITLFPIANLLTGILQFLIVGIVLYVMYKLFNLFF